MTRRGINRATAVVFVVLSVFAFSACWSADSTGADPGAVFRHDFSLVPGLVGAVTSCFEVQSHVSGHKYLCRIVEGDERVGQPGNWDVKFDGGDHPVASNCFNAFTLLKCVMVAPDGMTYEGCYPYNSNGTSVWWCDYKTHNWFFFYTNSDPWRYVLNTFWDWASASLANEAQCAYGIVSLVSGQGAVDNDWLANCFEGPL